MITRHRKNPFLQKTPSERFNLGVHSKGRLVLGGRSRKSGRKDTSYLRSPSSPPPPGYSRGTTEGLGVKAQKLHPRAAGTRLPGSLGHQTRHPPATDSAAAFNSLAPRTPPASAQSTTAQCNLFPSSPAQTRTPQQLTRPAWPKSTWGPFWTPRSLWSLHQCLSTISTWRRD